MMKATVLVLTALVCMSGQMPSNADSKLAMTKSTKPEKTADENTESNTVKYEAPVRQQKAKGKSAARKIMDGEGSYSAQNTHRKSAAKRAMELEAQ